ncbi:lysozyme family protein (plasmid) [Bacillus subtilis]|uniref:Lysozyme family protein n=1 Tax=Bacillus subtilis TaxID=1423 RepID=A0AAX3RJI4_BACIU|nr:bifunctional lytic transglycosylase/C40 family peptidase [Bacillus subtilis]
MNPALVVRVSLLLKDNWKEVLIGLIIVPAALIIIIAGALELDTGGGGDVSNSPYGTANVPSYIAKWRPLLEEYTTKYGVAEYTEFLLALMNQEIGPTKTLDIMQSSESLGLPPNAIQDPAVSVDAGVKHFKSVLEQGKKAGVDFNTIVQSYNYGTGYIGFVAKHGKKHTKELAQEFSGMMAARNRWSSYGDPDYVAHVMRYLKQNQGDIAVNGASDSPLGVKAFNDVMKEAKKYEGQPYVFGGDTPASGFDCSGLTQWVYRKAGINLPRTAQMQYDAVAKVSDPKPGDMVFFKGTYNAGVPITHVGIYIDNNTMYDSNNGGIGFHKLSGYWEKHLAGYGRPKR